MLYTTSVFLIQCMYTYIPTDSFAKFRILSPPYYKDSFYPDHVLVRARYQEKYILSDKMML